MNVLISSAGRRVSLVRFFQQELSKLYGNTARVAATDLDVSMSPACRFANLAFNVGKFTEPDYMDRLLDLCVQNKIRLVVPTIDTELILYAKHAHRFADHGVSVLISDLELVNRCRDKRETNQLFADLGIKTPQEVDLNAPTFPVFIKPVNGSSSVDLLLARKAEDVPEKFWDKERYIWMEYFAPKLFREFTVDLYYDRQSALKCAVPRLRIAVRSGEILKGLTQKGGVYDKVLDRFRFLKGARGCITLQLFERIEDGELFGIEINARFGGGYPLSYLAGANFIEWCIQEYLDHKTNLDFFDAWKDRTLLLRYDAEYVQYDYEY